MYSQRYFAFVKLKCFELAIICNPAVNKGDILDKRLCKHCGGYFGDINLKNSHEKECKKKSTSPQVTERLRPSRAKARRGVELLCMLEDDDHWEWYDMTDLDYDASDIPEKSVCHGTPVMPVENRIPIWTDEE